MGDITIRTSSNQDRNAIGDLAALDSQSRPHGDALLAFEGDELVAALPFDGGRPIADPFHHTAEIVDLLQLRAAQAQMPAAMRRQRHIRDLGLAGGRAA